MARITIDVDLTPEVEITGYQRYQDGHGLEVRWPLPARCRCEKCGHDDVAHIEFKTSPQAIRAGLTHHFFRAYAPLFPAFLRVSYGN